MKLLLIARIHVSLSQLVGGSSDKGVWRGWGWGEHPLSNASDGEIQSGQHGEEGEYIGRLRQAVENSVLTGFQTICASGVSQPLLQPLSCFHPSHCPVICSHLQSFPFISPSSQSSTCVSKQVLCKEPLMSVGLIVEVSLPIRQYVLLSQPAVNTPTHTHKLTH